MRNFIKQFLCNHSDITATTEVSAGSIFIVKTLIKCNHCNKSFPQHPSARCCYVEHVHANAMQEYLIKDIINMKQKGQQNV